MPDIDSTNNLAKVFLQNRWAPYVIPSVLFILCWKLQALITVPVGMAIPGGYFILSFTHGARITSFFLFGFRAVIGMTIGAYAYFYLFPDALDTQSYSQFALQNVVYTLIVYFCVEIVRRARALNDNFDGFKYSDIVWMIVISAVACAAIKPAVVSYSGQSDQLSIVSFQIASRIIGSLVVLYASMLSLSILQQVNIPDRSK